MNYKTTMFSQISNIIFFASIIFCLFFLWCNYYTKSINLSFLSALIVLFAFLIIYIPLKIQSKNKKKSIRKSKDDIDYFKLQLQFSQTSLVIEILKQYLNTHNFQKISTSHYFINNQFDLYLFLNSNNTEENTNSIFANRISNNIKILTISTFDIPIFIENTNIEFIDILDLYQNYKRINIKLDAVELNKKPQYSLSYFLRIILCKQKSKNYFFIGLLLLFSSLLTPYSTYYILFSSLLFIMSLISRFNFSFEFKKTHKK